LERLFEAGALDVTVSPVYIKKNRPATLRSVVTVPELVDELASIVFAETSTLGVRVIQAERRVLSRQIAPIETRYGAIRVKFTEAGNFAPEYDDCRKAAVSHGVPLRAVMAEASDAFRKQMHISK
jgi:pyridinium-3,5-bisthiocarboxylic acid mononucleotide nickel chelatase